MWPTLNNYVNLTFQCEYYKLPANRATTFIFLKIVCLTFLIYAYYVCTPGKYYRKYYYIVLLVTIIML